MRPPKFPRGTILPIVFGLGIILFIYVFSFILYFKQESRITYMYSSRIAAQKLADIGLDVFRQLAKSKLRDPESPFAIELKKAKRDMENLESEPIDLTIEFKKLVDKIKALNIDHFNILEWKAVITINPDDFEEFKSPLATYSGIYEKYGVMRLTVTAKVGVEGSLFASVEAKASEITEVKVNIASIPLLADFTLFIGNARSSGAYGLNRTILDEKGEHSGGSPAPIVLTNGNLSEKFPILNWRKPIANDLFTKDDLGQQGWVYLGSGKNTSPVYLKPAFRLNDVTGPGEDPFDERFTFYLGPPPYECRYSDKEFPAQMIAEAKKNDDDLIEDGYRLRHMDLGVFGKPSQQTAEIKTLYGFLKEPNLNNSSSQAPFNGYESSTLKPFGLDKSISPTIVFGNVLREYITLSWIIVPDGPDPDSQTLGQEWKDVVKESYEGGPSLYPSLKNVDDPNYVIDNFFYAPLLYCSSKEHYTKLMTQTKYKFIKEFTGSIFADYDKYTNRMTYFHEEESYNTALDYIVDSGLNRIPSEQVLGDSGYYNGKNATNKSQCYPKEFQHGVTPSSSCRQLMNILEKVKDHLDITQNQRIVWNARGDINTFMKDYKFLQSSGGQNVLNLGTVIYSEESPTIGPFPKVLRGGIIVCTKDITVVGPIGTGAKSGPLTIISLGGNIRIKYTIQGNIKALLIAPEGTIQTSGGQILLEGALAVQKLPPGTLSSISTPSFITYNSRLLKQTPDQEQDPETATGLIMVESCPVGNPLPTAALGGDGP